MTEEERALRIHIHNAVERATGELGWYYVSFADETTWFGACFVQAYGFGTACEMAHRLHINPGGQAFGGCIHEDIERVPQSYRCRLLSKEDLESLAPGEIKTVGEFRDATGFKDEFPSAETIDQDEL